MTPEPYWMTPIPVYAVEPSNWTPPTTPAQLRAYREASMLSLDDVARAAGVRKDAVWEAETVKGTRLSPAAYVAAVQRARKQAIEHLDVEIKTLQEQIGDHRLKIKAITQAMTRER